MNTLSFGLIGGVALPALAADRELDWLRRNAYLSGFAGAVVLFVIAALLVRAKGPADPEPGVGIWIEDPETGDRIYSSDGIDR